MVMCLYTARIPIRFMAVTNCDFFFLSFFFVVVFFVVGGEIGRQLLVVVSALVDLFLDLEVVPNQREILLP